MQVYQTAAIRDVAVGGVAVQTEELWSEQRTRRRQRREKGPERERPGP